MKILLCLLLIMISTFSLADELTSKKRWLSFSGQRNCPKNFCAEAISYEALDDALNFYQKNKNLIMNNDYLGIIDYSILSTQKRFFILNLKDGSVESLLVTHGKKSETTLAESGTFSNEVGSEMSSLGFYITDKDSYIGKHGLSLRLDGVSKTNSNARIRNIVLHGADYATQWFADTKGRLGLSQGCPAVAPNKIEDVIKKLKAQALLYIYKDDASPSL